LKYRGLIFHTLRRTGVTNLLDGGIRENVAMKISGHLTREILDAYDQADRRQVIEAKRKMDEYFALLSKRSVEESQPSQSAPQPQPQLIQ